MLDIAMKVRKLDGLELVSNWHIINDKNVEQVKNFFKERNLKICMVAPDL